MATRNRRTQPRSSMATMFPELYREPTEAELELSRRPMPGMLFEIDQEVQRAITGDRGTVESCTAHLDGRLEYVVTWSNGRRGWAFESELRAVEGER